MKIFKFLFLSAFNSYSFFSNDLKEVSNVVEVVKKEKIQLKNKEIKFVVFDINGSFWKPKTNHILSSYSEKQNLSIFTKIKLGGYFVALKMGTINFKSAYNAFLSNSKGLTRASIKKTCNLLWNELCVDNIYKKSAEIFNKYKKDNVKMIAVSSSITELCDDLLNFYKFDHVCSSRMGYKDGVVTGKLVGQPCAGKYKKNMVKDLIEKDLKGSLSEVAFYINSYRDIALANLVGKPVAFNPDSKLEAYAKSHGWEIIKTDEVIKAGTN